MPTTQEILELVQRRADAARGRAGKPGIGAAGEFLQNDPYYIRSILGAVLGAAGAIRSGQFPQPPRFIPTVPEHRMHTGPYTVESHILEEQIPRLTGRNRFVPGEYSRLDWRRTENYGRAPSDRRRGGEVRDLISEHHTYTGGRTRNRGRTPTPEDVQLIMDQIPQFYVSRQTTSPSTGSNYVDVRNRQTSFLPRLTGGDISAIAQGPLAARIRFTPNDPHPPASGVIINSSLYPRDMFLDTSGQQNPFLNASVARDIEGNLLSQNRYIFRNELRRRLLEQLNPQSPIQETNLQTQISPNQLSFLRALLGE